MKKLTELDLQTALDECESIRFRTHGDWLAGMVKRLNKALESYIEPVSIPLIPTKENSNYKVTIIQSGNAVEPEVPCIS